MVFGILGWVFAGFILAQLIVFGLLLYIKSLNISFGGLDQNVLTMIVNIVTYGLMIAVVIGLPILLKKWGASKKELAIARGLRGKDILWLLAGIGGYIVLTIVINIASRALIPNADYDQTQETGFGSVYTNWQLLVVFISLVVIAPVAEELLFRGYLLGKLLRHAPVWLAIVLSAGLFAVAHGQFNVGLDTFALGTVLAFIRIKSGSLWPSMMLHTLKNFLAFYILFVNPGLI